MKTKLHRLAYLFLFISSIAYTQKLEKIKGSKIVTLSEIALDSITSIELYKNIDLVIKKGTEDKLTINADDNLHDVLDLSVSEGKLSLSLLKRITGKKAFDLTLYISNLNEIILDDNSSLFCGDFYQAESLNITLNNKSKLNCFLEADVITFQGNDSSKSESNFKTQSMNYILQDRAKVKNNSNADITKITAEGRANISLTGTTDMTYIKSSQTTDVKLSGLISTNTEITAEDKSTIHTNTKENLTISIKDNCKVSVYGNAAIDLLEFKGQAIISKKE